MKIILTWNCTKCRVEWLWNTYTYLHVETSYSHQSTTNVSTKCPVTTFIVLVVCRNSPWEQRHSWHPERKAYFFIFISPFLSFSHILLVACYIMSLSLSTCMFPLSSSPLALSLYLNCLLNKVIKFQFVFLAITRDDSLWFSYKIEQGFVAYFNINVNSSSTMPGRHRWKDICCCDLS